MTSAMKKQTFESLRTDPDWNLWVLLDQTRFAICRARELELAKSKLTIIQASVLYTIQFKGGEITQKQISEFTMRQHHSVSTLINRMIKRGLIKKVKHTGEKGTKIAITEKGKETYNNITKQSIKMIFSTLSAEDKQNMTAYLDVLRNKARGLLGMDYIPPFLSTK